MEPPTQKLPPVVETNLEAASLDAFLDAITRSTPKKAHTSNNENAKPNEKQKNK